MGQLEPYCARFSKHFLYQVSISGIIFDKQNLYGFVTHAMSFNIDTGIYFMQD
jgi:hypothetical protein